MSKRMLVDANHPEEVRVAVVQDQRLLELEIESSAREQIKGNIYLGQVTRVEPSLQAAFVDFNGGRQGFLSVNDIHSKYYAPNDPPPPPPADIDDDALDEGDEEIPLAVSRGAGRRRPPPIQSFLTKDQTLLVQVVKEARGNKGATLTTNISLAGRYTVLLPENGGGGGVSRKIEDATERKALREMLNELEIPKEISLIIRTAGMGRNKREIKRDMLYLHRLWNKIQEDSAKAKPPRLIHQEGDLILRTIRDLYTTDTEEILIEGGEAYRLAREFMRLIMPSYVKVIKPYKDPVPLFARHQVESQIESMHERMVPMKAGGYLVIDHTEALVTIDINSGRSTRERDVESTAFKTNMQAVDEIARQLRLRDLGGLVVIDFIDMEDKKHNAEVEKRLKEVFKLDRAKIQLGRVSQFGLLELSRQRLKPTFSETSRLVCPRCQGLGTVRSVESTVVQLFRTMQMDAANGRYQRLTYHVPQEVAHYLLNQKRTLLNELEASTNTTIVILGDTNLLTPEFRVEKVDRPKGAVEEKPRIVAPVVEPEDENDVETPEEERKTPEGETPTRRRRRRRRRRRGGGGVAGAESSMATSGDNPDEMRDDEDEDEGEEDEEQEPASPPPPPVRRGAIPTAVPGIYSLAAPEEPKPVPPPVTQPPAPMTEAVVEEVASPEEAPVKPAPRRRRAADAATTTATTPRRRTKKVVAPAPVEAEHAAPVEAASVPADQEGSPVAAEKPVRRRRRPATRRAPAGEGGGTESGEGGTPPPPMATEKE